MLRDLKLAWRSLSKNSGFTWVAVVTIALGIGANTAVFSVINTVLLKPLPYQEADRLALIWTNFGADLPQNWISGPEFVEMREFNTAFEDLSVVVPLSTSVTGDGEPEQVGTGAASATFFNVLRVRPALGRLFQASDDAPGAPPVVVLGHGFWQRRYGADGSVIGKSIRIEGLPCTIVGVLPPDFAILHPDTQFPPSVDLWAPLTMVSNAAFGVDSYEKMSRGSHGFRGIGRLRDGVTMAQAQADMNAVARSMFEKSPDYYDFEGWGLTVIPLHEDLVEDVRPALLIILGAVGFVLLIACVNVANLLLARAASREREIALRTALGASQGRLARQVLSESLLLALAGGVAGLGLAGVLVSAMKFLSPGNLPRGGEVSLDSTVLLFTFAAAVARGLLFGLAPLIHGFNRNLVESLKESARGASAGIRGRGFRQMLVVGEVALALILAVGAGLMLKSFSRLMESNPGYRLENLLTLRISLPNSKYPTPNRTQQFYDRLLERIGALPDVISLGGISQLPLSGKAMSGTTRVFESQTVPEDQRATEVDRRVVAGDYFQAMGVQLLQGRTFTAQDASGSSLVAIVDDQFVKRFWPTEEPLGKMISINRNEGGRVWREVVGVVRHSRHVNVDRIGREQAYFPLAQFPFNSLYLAIRTRDDPLSAVSAIRRELSALDPDQPIEEIQSMQSRFDSVVAQPRFNLLLLAAFAGIALTLATIGIYGVVSYSVSQRQAEIGVRMAMGADSGAVRRLVLRQGLGMVLISLLLGLPAGLALTRLMDSMLFEVEAADPATFSLVAVLLVATAALACYIPARRATRVDPVQVLSGE